MRDNKLKEEILPSRNVLLVEFNRLALLFSLYSAKSKDGNVKTPSKELTH